MNTMNFYNLGQSPICLFHFTNMNVVFKFEIGNFLNTISDGALYRELHCHVYTDQVLFYRRFLILPGDQFVLICP